MMMIQPACEPNARTMPITGLSGREGNGSLIQTLYKL